MAHWQTSLLVQCWQLPLHHWPVLELQYLLAHLLPLYQHVLSQMLLCSSYLILEACASTLCTKSSLAVPGELYWLPYRDTNAVHTLIPSNRTCHKSLIMSRYDSSGVEMLIACPMVCSAIKLSRQVTPGVDTGLVRLPAAWSGALSLVVLTDGDCRELAKALVTRCAKPLL